MWKIVYYNNNRNKKGNYDFNFRGTFINCHHFINYLKADRNDGLAKRLFVEPA